MPCALSLDERSDAARKLEVRQLAGVVAAPAGNHLRSAITNTTIEQRRALIRRHRQQHVHRIEPPAGAHPGSDDVWSRETS
jgi:hypothetical protein